MVFTFAFDLVDSILGDADAVIIGVGSSSGSTKALISSSVGKVSLPAPKDILSSTATTECKNGERSLQKVYENQ